MLPFKLMAQLPQLVAAVWNERQWLKKFVTENQVDVVISDNRFGLYTPGCYCVFITHQLEIQAPFPWLQKLVRKLNYSFINRFKECWVPDFAGSHNLSGSLGHPAKPPSIPTYYIGPLSRFSLQPQRASKWKWLFLLSGPEPQRTALEDKLLKVSERLPGSKLLLRGLPNDSAFLPGNDQLTVLSHLGGQDLQAAIQEANTVVCRAGYTSIMELVALNAKAVLVPTPGQTEQEYLAGRLENLNWFGSALQSLPDEVFAEKLLKASGHQYTLPKVEELGPERFLSAFINRVKKLQQ